MRIVLRTGLGLFRGTAALTIEEVVISLGIAALGLSSILSGYLLAIDRSQWAAFDAAAQRAALVRIEQVQCAQWDPCGNPPIDELVTARFPPGTAILDALRWGTNRTYGTTEVKISTISVDPFLKMIEVDCVWSYRSRGLFTNRIVSYRNGH